MVSVYIQEIDGGDRPIKGVNTAVAGFIGFTEDIRGGAELFKPMLGRTHLILYTRAKVTVQGGIKKTSNMKSHVISTKTSLDWIYTG